MRADLAEELEAVGIGQPEVEHDERRFHVSHGLAGLGRGARVLDDEIGVAEVERHELRDRRVVLDDDDARGHARNAKRGSVPHL